MLLTTQHKPPGAVTSSLSAIGHSPAVQQLPVGIVNPLAVNPLAELPGGAPLPPQVACLCVAVTKPDSDTQTCVVCHCLPLSEV